MVSTPTSPIGAPLDGGIGFGTDGIRGRVGTVVTPLLALQVGFWTGRVLPPDAPVVIGTQIKAGTPQNAMYGFAVFYAACLLLNWWFYLRAGAEIKNP